MAKKNETGSTLKEITISMHCITFNIALLTVEMELPEDFDKNLLHEVMNLTSECIEKPSGLEKMLKRAILLENEIADYPLKKSKKEFIYNCMQTFEELL